MRIAEIRTYLMQAGAPADRAWASDGKGHQTGSRNWLFVKVLTDEGVYGVGECSGWPRVIEAAVKDLASVLVGEDPANIEKLWQKMMVAQMAHGMTGVVGAGAMSGIDMALWDIKGQALGVPIWKLLGGGFHEKVRCYASSLFGGTPAETGERARRFAGLGFTAVKFGWDPMGQDEATDLALVHEARRGLGDKIDLLVDAGLVWDAKTAIQRARAFADDNIFWLEEPLRPDDYDGYRRLTEATHLRIAAGEEESTRLSYLDLMDRGNIDVVQVDLTRCGGFTEGMKIASLAWDRSRPVANHGFTTYINVAAALHWLNAIPNALICEFVAQEGTNLRDLITRQRFEAKDGYLQIPQAPGLGVDLDDDVVAKYRVC